MVQTGIPRREAEGGGGRGSLGYRVSSSVKSKRKAGTYLVGGTLALFV